ncbi:putative Mre11 subunit [Encephalitozoon hellem ATCC 50504]|uniref:Double-strand break repair protein n=1 Tax=Encephalitozoon hellem TaxID=27973 RepID=A0A9Q9C448_ENCHE|nr:putative Mre11 subunit [Encephalitozoon hellem ATCC 50504]AFM98349.1 putative Mre11 subunit [Encephalitozoon hellem ATCC 50504]UTX43230.1 DNA repair and telomere maintenance protein Nbs1 [Encephalitozoon hellem]|eukprot:XP_003887330.1 putative Mre11 subunit [Encephalitozoon hellem ATCC 50504]
MKILITSDNHLGYKESDPVLFDDSYNTFEEILNVAQRERVDLILQGGDLFHENRPSRNCLNKTIGLLRRYCVGNGRSCLKSNWNLNLHDQNITISVPVVAIHGNHDDPSGVNMVSPLDILHSSGLVNYIGKHSLMDRIDVFPLLLQKEYRVAIYGMGHIKDRRLYRMFCEGRVVFHKPKDYDSWYNILVLHQNRVPREKEHVSLDFIDDFFDLVIYGHEHESKVINEGRLILQPGSTVRTSLCEGERYNKYIYILRIGEECILEHVRLRSVRPFVLDVLRIEGKCNAEELARDKVKKMIDAGKKKEAFSCEKATFVDVDTKRFKCKWDIADDTNQVTSVSNDYLYEEKNYIPIIRLKIELHGNGTFDRHKLGMEFKGLVANPNDMLSISRRIGRREGIEVRPTEEKIEITRILRRILGNVEFGVLSRLCFSESLEEYVRGDSNAFIGMIRKNIEKIINSIDYSSIVDEDVIKAMKRISCEEDRCYGEEQVESRAYQDATGKKKANINHTDEELKKRSYSEDNNEENEPRAKKGFTVEDLLEKERLSGKIKNSKEDSSTDVSFTFSKYL